MPSKKSSQIQYLCKSGTFLKTNAIKLLLQLCNAEIVSFGNLWSTGFAASTCTGSVPSLLSQPKRGISAKCRGC